MQILVDTSVWIDFFRRISSRETALFKEALVDYLAAANIYRSLRRRGLTIRSPVDCLIAALAIKQKASLLHKDTDFTLIAQHFPLSVI